MNRLKKSVVVLMLCVTLICGGSAFAIDEELIFTTAFECRGNVYFCDPSSSTVVLKNLDFSGIVDPAIVTDIRYIIEYTEVPINLGGILAQGRGRIDGETVNSEYADAKVKVIIAKNKRGYKVISMTCGID